MLWRAVAETIRKTVCKKYAIAGWSLKTTEEICNNYDMVGWSLKHMQRTSKHYAMAGWSLTNTQKNKCAGVQKNAMACCSLDNAESCMQKIYYGWLEPKDYGSNSRQTCDGCLQTKKYTKHMQTHTVCLAGT